ncbi:glycosyltransferase family 2 protein [Rhizobium nepotum]|uniref:glycosyltransferase family 2 protein n=1 Tax=Rhizobium nepotum TaxID=1035271 RepID=UPI00336AC14F
MLQLPKTSHFGVSIQVQSILYHVDEASIRRALESLTRAIELAVRDGHCTEVRVSYGDTSAQRCLSEAALERLSAEFSGTFDLSYRFFDENLGSARGHNRLSEHADTDFLLILNPDVVVSPRLFENMLAPFSDEKTGMVEAKQLPIEHPKAYDPNTGETGWATTACALTPTALFNAIEGFDADTFFLYCDDVDYSWRVREAGYKVIFMPSAVVFHDKRVSQQGAWQPSSAERRYSAEAGLLMAHKWSRPDLVKRIASTFRNGGPDELAALKKFEEKEAAGTLPTPRDAAHRIGGFDGHFYTKHRFIL